MESSEREPSYYEVALTHRQVMVGLVVALTTVVVAFFAGIWIGRDQSVPLAAGAAGAAATTPSAGAVDTLTFFGDKPAGADAKPAARPASIAPSPPRAAATEEADLEAPAPADSASAKLRATLEAEMAANRVEGTEAPAVAPGARVTRDGAVPPAPSTDAGANEPTVVPATGALWIQVYSSPNRERASEISARLEKGGFGVLTLAPAAATGPNYRVRVGPYPDRARADRAATRLRREHKLDTWITDSP